MILKHHPHIFSHLRAGGCKPDEMPGEFLPCLCTGIYLQFALPWKWAEALCLDLQLYRSSHNAGTRGQSDFSPVHSADHSSSPWVEFTGFAACHSESQVSMFCYTTLEHLRSDTEPWGPPLVSRRFLPTKRSVNSATDWGQNLALRV